MNEGGWNVFDSLGINHHAIPERQIDELII